MNNYIDFGVSWAPPTDRPPNVLRSHLALTVSKGPWANIAWDRDEERQLIYKDNMKLLLGALWGVTSFSSPFW